MVSYLHYLMTNGSIQEQEKMYLSNVEEYYGFINNYLKLQHDKAQANKTTKSLE
jgi:hypothetical protein